jgi:hypothetical protein
MNLQELTVIIWTNCKRKEIKKICEYWSHNGARILILATDDSIYRILENTKVDSIFIDPDLGARLQFASKNIFTKYSILHGDDDLTLAPAVSKGIRFLERNQDIGAIFGEVMLFDKQKGFINYYIYRGKRKYQQKNIIDHLSNYQFSFIMALHRTKTFRILLQTVSNSLKIPKMKECPALSVEIGFEICSVLEINIKKISSIFMLKQVGNELPKWQPITNEWLDNNKLTILQWVKEIVKGVKSTNLNKFQQELLVEEVILGLEKYSSPIQKLKIPFKNRIKWGLLQSLQILFSLLKKFTFKKIKYFIPGVGYGELKKISNIFN